MKLLTLGLVLVLAFQAASGADIERGKQLYSEGKYAEAAGELRQLIRDNPDDATAHRYLGLVLLEQNDLTEAARHIEKAHDLEASPENRLALARLHIARKDFDKAEESLKDASGDDLEYVRGLLHLHRKRYDDAVSDFEAYLSRNPDHAYAHYYAGLAYNGANRPDKMLSHFQTFLNKKPDAPEARKVRAVLKTGK